MDAWISLVLAYNAYSAQDIGCHVFLIQGDGNKEDHKTTLFSIFFVNIDVCPSERND